MIPLSLLAFSLSLPADIAEPVVDPIAEMARPDWLQRELRQTPPNSMAPTSTVSYAPPPPPRPAGYLQGLFGVSEVRVKDIGTGNFDDSDDAQMPLIGGAVQRPLTGDNLRLGVEGGFLFGWAGNVETIVVGGGGVAITGSNDLFLTEGFGGLYADVMLGQKVRLYGGAGGLIDWAIVDLTYSDPGSGFFDLSGSGFGFGWYTRAGFELLLQSGMAVGFCWRWFDTSIDIGGDIGDLDLEGMQYMLTFTKSM
jgi:hypothetical protein